MKSPEMMLALLVLNVIAVVYTIYELRNEQKENRGWYGFWLALSLNACGSLIKDLLELLNKA